MKSWIKILILGIYKDIGFKKWFWGKIDKIGGRGIYGNDKF